MDWKTLDRLIDEFEGMIDSKLGREFPPLGFLFSGSSWKDIWAKAAEIQNGFKGIRCPTKAQRDEAWERFNSLRNEASKRHQDESNNRSWKSESHRSAILRQIGSARPTTLFGFAAPDVEEMKALGQVLREAGQMLSKYKGEMLGEHKQECFEAIQDMRHVHDAWWAELDKSRQRRRQEREAKIRNNLERNYERHRKATQALVHFRSRADELRFQIASAWNDSWASKAEGWLSELEDKISNIEHSIEQIEEWIREDEAKLG